MSIASVYFSDTYFGQDSYRVTHPEDIKQDTKLLVLWGGEDISPGLYGEINVRSHGCNPRRDETECRMVEYAVEAGIPILGICRGAQLLCAMDNGKLWQHVTNHAYGGPEAHKIITITGEVIPTNSAHHQMMRPAPYTTTVVGWSHLVRSPVKWNQDGEHETQEKEPELVWFQKLNAIGVQGHPEWLPHNSPLTMYTKRMLKEYLNVEI